MAEGSEYRSSHQRLTNPVHNPELERKTKDQKPKTALIEYDIQRRQYPYDNRRADDEAGGASEHLGVDDNQFVGFGLLFGGEAHDDHEEHEDDEDERHAVHEWEIGECAV